MGTSPVLSRRSLALALTIALPACRATPSPIPGVKQPRAETRQAEVLVIFLPGLTDHPADTIGSGLPAALRATGVDADLLTLDGHFGYYMNGQLWTRVYEDAVQPARARGQRVWIVGISMGCLGALMTAERYRGHIDGLVLLSPFAGRPGTTRRIAKAGGATRWQPPERRGPYDVELWRWLRDYDERSPEYPTIIMGYGLDEAGPDRHYEVLASLLPDAQVFTRAGPHDWETWTALWAELLPTLARALEG